MSAVNSRRLKAFSSLVHENTARDMGMLACIDRSRDLSLLADIQSTLDMLDVEHEQACQAITTADYYIELVKNAKVVIDPSEDILPLFERARDTVGQAFEHFETAYLSAKEDPQLTTEDGIADGFFQQMQLMCTLHNKLNQLAWTIGENDAEYDAVNAISYDNAEDLFKSLGV